MSSRAGLRRARGWEAPWAGELRAPAPHSQSSHSTSSSCGQEGITEHKHILTPLSQAQTQPPFAASIFRQRRSPPHPPILSTPASDHILPPRRVNQCLREHIREQSCPLPGRWGCCSDDSRPQGNASIDQHTRRWEGHPVSRNPLSQSQKENLKVAL